MVARITRMGKRRLGELLQAEGLIAEEQIAAARNEQRKNNMLFSEALVKLGYISEDALASAIAQQFNLPFIYVENYTITKDILPLFPQQLLWDYQFIPLEKLNDVLIIAGAGLINHDMLNELERASSCRVFQYVASWGDIRNAIEKVFKDFKPKEEESDLSDLGKMLFDDSANQGSADAAPATATPPDGNRPLVAAPSAGFVVAPSAGAPPVAGFVVKPGAPGGTMVMPSPAGNLPPGKMMPPKSSALGTRLSAFGNAKPVSTVTPPGSEGPKT